MTGGSRKHKTYEPPTWEIVPMEEGLYRAFYAALAATGEDLKDVLLRFIRIYVNHYAPAGPKPKARGGRR